MMQKDIAALVGSRICHDLISPIGAIGNGVELMQLSDGDTKPEMALSSESVDNANARIRFFRIAYGTASAEQQLGRSDILSILASSARGGRFTYFWQIDSDLPRSDVRIAFLIIQCFETALPLGGDIHISRQGDKWEMQAVGDRIKVDAELWESLSNPSSAYVHSAAQVQFALLPSVLSESARKLDIHFEAEKITLTF